MANSFFNVLCSLWLGKSSGRLPGAFNGCRGLAANKYLS